LAPVHWLSAVGLIWLLGTGSAAGATLQLVGPDNASVTLNGQDLGRFPLTSPLTLEPGQHELKCELKGYESYEENLLIEEDDDWTRVRVRMTPLKRRTAVLTNIVFAGIGQRYMGKNTKGWIFTGAELTGLVLAVYGELSYQNHHDNYKLSMDEYQRAVLEEDIALHRSLAEDAYSKAQSAHDIRDNGLYLALGAIAVSMLDAFLFFPKAETKPQAVPVGGSPGSLTGHLAVGSSQGITGSAGLYAGWRLQF
jgi:hypothetical protein